MRIQLKVGVKLHCSNGCVYSIAKGKGFYYPLAIVNERGELIDYISHDYEHLYTYGGQIRLYIGDPVIDTMVVKIT